MLFLGVVDATTGLGVGLLVAALLLGLRHGIDWDHIAAITDIAATQKSERRGLLLGTLYALGHAMVVFVIGVVAIVAGRNLPSWADALMGRVVGATLLLLGVYVVYALIRYRGEFRPRSRWMLLLGGVRRLYVAAQSWLRPVESEPVEHEHDHVAVEEFHHESTPELVAVPKGSRLRAPLHSHRHRHTVPSGFATAYSPGGAVGVGMLHGVGAETPTQVLVFLAAANAGGPGAGILVLAVFLLGLLASNSLITLGSVFGFKVAGRRRAVFVGVGVVTAAFSLVIGTVLLLGQDVLLPALLAG
jgi:high-affinity nickel-transport protein